MNEASLERDGYEVVRRVIPPTVLRRLVAAVERVQASVADLPPELLGRLIFERDLPAGRRDGVAASDVGDAIFILGDPAAFDGVFWTLLEQPEIVGAMRKALGGANLVAHFMNVTIKHPRFGRGIGWHRDFPNRYACTEGSRFIRAMVCLDGMSDTSGATAFLPGSHRIGDEEAVALFRAGERLPEPRGEIGYARCDPGDMVLIHPKVLHGGSMNRSPRPRRNIVLQAGNTGVPLVVIPEEERVTGRVMRPASAAV